jgi:ABC-type bacteriocin/lantibiotic exporter with double-glycine peptidase domain
LDKADFQKFHVEQKSIAECGIACLQTIFKVYGFEANKESLKKLTGTTNRGTTLLGLCEASNSLGLHAEGYEANLQELKKITTPTILHVIINKNQLHYVVCFAYTGTHFLIGDPGRGIEKISPTTLEDIWKSKRLLLFSGQVDSMKFHSLNSPKKGERKIGIWNLVEEDIGLLISSGVLGLVASILGLSLAYFSQVLLDDLLKNQQDFTKLTLAMLILLLTLLSRNALVFFKDFIFLKQGRNLSQRMNRYFYRKLLNLSISYYQSMHTGDLIARMNDTVRIQSVVNYIFSSLVIDIFLFLTLIVFLFLSIPTLGLAIIGFSALFFLVSYSQTKKVIKAQKTVIESYGLNESTYLNTLQAIDVIKVHNKENLFSKLASDVHGLFQEKLFRFGRFKNRLNLIYAVSGSLIVIITIYFATQMYFEKELLVGSLVALMQVSLLIVSPITNISLSNFRIQEAKIAFDRINEFVEAEPEYLGKEDSLKMKIDYFESLRIVGLNFKFPGTVKLIENINLSIVRGDFVALLGDSGAGKSTLLKVLQMFYEIPKNTVSVNNIEWNELSICGWRAVIGIVPQEIKLFNSSIAGNISVGETIDLPHIEKFCVDLGIDSFFQSMLSGYNTIVGETGVNLSGGQRQLVGLARALYKKPQLLLLDEATSFLDAKTQTYIFNLLKKHCEEQRITVLYVTHDAQLARYANKFVQI